MTRVATICLPRASSDAGAGQALEVRYRYHPARRHTPQPGQERQGVVEADAFIELLRVTDPDSPKPYGETPDELPFLSDAERAQVIEACWKHFFEQSK